MERGWFCIWRKIEDNISWSRGGEYRGVMITILQKTNWKPGFFLGHKIEPGQFPTSAENLGKELKISRQKCQRALAQLARDNFIKVENVSNRFTLITVINWDTYQEVKDSSEQQVSNQRATDEQQVGTIKQGNKETKKQIKDSIKDTACVGSAYTSTCPQKKIITLWNETMPELPQIREWPAQSEKNLRARWRAKPEAQNLTWWKELFIYIRKSDFLMGRAKEFQATLQWIVIPSNYSKIINGNYENRSTGQSQLSRDNEAACRAFIEED